MIPERERESERGVAVRMKGLEEPSEALPGPDNGTLNLVSRGRHRSIDFTDNGKSRRTRRARGGIGGG